MSTNSIETKLSKNRRLQSTAPERYVKNVVVAKNDSLSLRGLIAWVKKILEIDNLIFDDMRTGAIYCQLLHSLFPKSISFHKIRLTTNVTTEFESNFRLLSGAFKKLGIVRNIPVDQLIKGPANYEFCNWFHAFYLANWDGKPYSAREMRQYSAIGMIHGTNDLKRSQSIPKFDATQIIEDSINNSRIKRNCSLSRIEPRMKLPDTNNIDEELGEFCNESKSIELPSESSSDDDTTPKGISNEESNNQFPIPDCFANSNLKSREQEILRLRKLFMEATEKLDSIKIILLENFNNPSYSLYQIRKIVFKTLPTDKDNQ